MNAAHEFGECPSRLRFDRWLARELAVEQMTQVELHAAQCRRCGAVLEELRRGYEAFSPVLPGALVQRVRQRNPKRRALVWAAPLLAAAAALLMWTRSDDASLDGTRSKGGSQLTFYVMHEGVARPGVDGERVRPGDALRFAYSSERAAYLAIVSIDGASKASAYFAEGGRAAKVGAASRALLDQSTVLDATLGSETVYGMLCKEPIDLDPVLRALERTPDKPPAVADCALERIALHKVPR
jgi:hypothetical protein